MPRYYEVTEIVTESSGDIVSQEVIGRYRAPTLFCDCLNKKGGYTQGTKYFWWVHSACGKPSIQWAMNPAAVISAGVEKAKLTIENS